MELANAQPSQKKSQQKEWYRRSCVIVCSRGHVCFETLDHVETNSNRNALGLGFPLALIQVRDPILSNVQSKVNL